MVADFGFIWGMVPLIAYLAARALAKPVGRSLRGAELPVLAVLGVASSAAMDAIAVGVPVSSTGISMTDGVLPALATDTLCASALFALAVRATAYDRRPRLFGSRPHTVARQAAAIAIPALVAVLSTLAIIALLPLVSEPVAWSGKTAGTALALAAVLWLSSDDTGTSLIVAGLLAALALPRSTAVDGVTAAVVSAALALATIALAIAFLPSERSGSRSSGPRAALRSLVPLLSLGLAWGTRLSGTSWTVAGLAAGLGCGLAIRTIHGGTAAPGRYGLTDMIEELGRALAFVAGFGLASERLARFEPMVWIAATAVLAAAMARGLVEKKLPRLPLGAGSLAVLLTAKRAGILGDDIVLGTLLAGVAALPFVWLRSRRASHHAPTLRAIVVDSGTGGIAALARFASAFGAPGQRIPVVRSVRPGAREGARGGDDDELLIAHTEHDGTETSIIPSIVVADGAAEGITAAAEEWRAEVAVLEAALIPGGNASSGQAQAGVDTRSLLLAMLSRYRGHIVATRHIESMAKARRLAIVIPSGLDAAVDLRLVTAVMSRAWDGPERDIETLTIGTPAAETARDSASGRSVASWREVPAALRSSSTGVPAVIVLLARPGTAAWNPGHDRLPDTLAAAFPDAPLMFWYPAGDASVEKAAGSPGDATTTPEGETSWPPLVASAYATGRILKNMNEAAIVDAIRRLTDLLVPGDRGASGRLAAEFSTIARKEPIELAPGVLLLHSHAPGVRTPTLAVGARPSGWPLVALQTPVRIVVAFVSPTESTPETHLAALAEIAVAFRTLGLADRLLAE